MLSSATLRKQDKYLVRIDELIDPIELDIPCSPWPTREDFARCWHTLDTKQQTLVSEAVKPQCVTVGDLYKLSLVDGLHETVETNSLYDRNVLRAILYAKMLRLPSDTARHKYYETLLDLRRTMPVNYEDIPNSIKTDRDHIIELAKSVDISPDGKRELHKQLIAYGMQTKVHEPAVIEKGITVKEAIYELADPRAVLNSLQELSKLDGSYKEAGREETDTIENQSDRIRRLKVEMQDELDEEAANLGGTARRISDEELLDNAADS